jgi:RNA polymerase sigma-70 factor (ECF subfamily)
VAWGRASARLGAGEWRLTTVNGDPGAMIFDTEGRLLGVLALDIAGGEVRALRSVVNPDKLAHLGLPVSDAGVRALEGRRRQG